MKTLSDGEFLLRMQREIAFARGKFPSNQLTTIAMLEEAGEVAKALMDETPERVHDEAVQLAVMAMRIATEGDASVDTFRIRKALSDFGGDA